MYSQNEFEIFTYELAEKFSLTQEPIHKNVVGLVAEGSHEHIVRMIYDSQEKKIGISFHIELEPTVAIQIFGFASRKTMSLNKERGLMLLSCYFQDENGTTYTGNDARLALEQDRQDHYLQVFSKASDEEIEKHLQRIEAGRKKPTWH